MAGAAIGGLAVGAIGGYSLMPPKEVVVTQTETVEVPLEVPEHPWGYQSIDAEAAAKRGYEAFFQGGCCYGVFEGIIGELRETYGHPYTAIPTKMSIYGKGGSVGWGTLCGALNGASLAINLLSNNLALVNEINGYYCETALPTYHPAEAKKVEGDLTQSVSGSPLCHVSVSKWCEASGFKEASDERKERCARLVADVIKKAIELLEQDAAGTFQAAYAVPETVVECNDCHGSEGPVGNVLSKMDCESCHGDPHAG